MLNNLIKNRCITVIILIFVLCSCKNTNEEHKNNKIITDNIIDTNNTNDIASFSEADNIDADNDILERKVFNNVIKEKYLDGSSATIVTLANNKTKKIVYDNINKNFNKNDVIKIDLSNLESVNGENLNFVKFIDGDLELYPGKVFALSGELTNGQIRIVGNENDIINIIFDGVKIKCNKEFAICSPFDCKINFIINENTENTITFETEVNKNKTNKKNNSNKVKIMEAAILAKNSIYFNGNGTLNINGNMKKAIWSGGNVYFNSGNYNIDDAKEAINGNLGIIIKSGKFDINVLDDGLLSENVENGFIYIEGGNINILSLKYGIKAINNFILTDGNVNIESADISVISRSIDILDGNLDIVSKKDCLNASDINQNKDEIYIRLAGGKLNLDSWFDGINSSGNLYFEGSNVYLSGPTRHAEMIIDYKGDIFCDKGDIIALGASKVVKDFGENPYQNYIIIYFNDARPKGWAFMLKDDADNVIMSFIPNKKYRVALITSDKLNIGSSYNIVSWEDSIQVDIKGKRNIIDLRK